MPREKPPSPQQIQKDVAAYLAALPKETRAVLKKLRAHVHASVPGGTQGFTYRMPCVRLEERPVVWYAGWKRHVSLYPMTAPIVRANAKALRGLETSKGTIRFPLDHPPSAALVKKLVASRLAEMTKPRAKKRAR
jgi:uncharacterized protein YdhG (YjbR/CyaY superfamily)